VGELTPPLQVKLLRVLENGEYSRVGSTQIRRADVRVVAATNRDLAELVREGKVRQDFLYRLNVVEVRMPPLRERRSDLPLLLRHFLAKLASRPGGKIKRLSAEAEALLLAYDYPGNIRELQNVLQRAVLLAEGPVIEPRHLPETLRELRPLLPQLSQEEETAASGFRSAKQRVVERFERDYITHCLQDARGNISQAAKAAGIDYKNFYTKMQQYGIEAGAFK
jgi:DNA-binding NtrC family response regulator